MEQSALVEKESGPKGKTVVRILVGFSANDVEVYRVEENMLDVAIDSRYRTRFWFPFSLGDKKVSFFVNNRAVEIDLYSIRSA